MSAGTTNLREPDPIDWASHDTKSTYAPPPPAKDQAGNYIIYTAQLPAAQAMRDPKRLGQTDEGFRSFELGPLTLLALPGGKTAQIRFYTVTTKLFTGRDGKPINMSSASKVLRAAGLANKPNTNAEYAAAVASLGGRQISLTIDWSARNKDTGEEIRGYDNFPDDPQRPGFKKAVLKQGDVLPSGEVVKSEVLFANARVRFVEGGK